MAIIRAGYEAGDVTLSVEAGNMETAQVRLSVK